MQLWAEIKHKIEYEIQHNGKSYSDVFRLTAEEKQLQSDRNAEHLKQLPAEQEIIDIIAEIQRPVNGFIVTSQPMSATAFKAEHPSLNAFSAQKIKKVLEKLGYAPINKTDSKGNWLKGVYDLPVKISANPYSTEKIVYQF